MAEVVEERGGGVTVVHLRRDLRGGHPILHGRRQPVDHRERVVGPEPEREAGQVPLLDDRDEP